MSALIYVALVAGLDAESFRVRQSCQAMLAESLPLSYAAVRRGLLHKSPEVAGRCRVVMRHPVAAGLREAEIDAEMAGWLKVHKRWPWITADEGIIDTPWCYWLERASLTVKAAGGPDWPRYRKATELWVRHELLQERSPWGEVADKARAECAWRQIHGN